MSNIYYVYAYIREKDKTPYYIEDLIIAIDLLNRQETRN